MTMHNLGEKSYVYKMIMRALVILGTIGFIVGMLPREKAQQIYYDDGRPWMYSSFIAQFDFPIYKTEQELRATRDSLRSVFQPYFTYQKQVGEEAVTRFKEAFKEGIQGLSADYVPLIADRLSRLYKTGILETNDFAELKKDTTLAIRVINGKSVESFQVECVFSVITAYEQLFHDPKLAAHREILQSCNLNEYIRPNLTNDHLRNESELNDQLKNMSAAVGMVYRGQKVIDRGEIVNAYTKRILNSYERVLSGKQGTAQGISSSFMGQLIFVSMLVLLFTLYLYLFRKDYFNNWRSLLMLYVLMTIFSILVSLMMKHNLLNVYILPFAIVPMFARVFMDSRTAFVTHVTTVLICAVAVSYQYEFIIVQLVAGQIAIYSLRELSSRSQVFKTAFYVMLGSMLIFFALQLIQDNNFSGLDTRFYKYFVISGIALLMVYPLLYVVEKSFGFISNVTLIELSNTNRGLLRKLSEEAPGTFQHSIVVGNLAAEIANKIGADSLLVRTGALYHDIGKLGNPAFFTENQAGMNPHNNLDLIGSARMVVSHVTEGLRLAENDNIPTVIKDFILTHHGEGVSKYFYVSYKNEHPGQEVDPMPFSYPGSNPSTREQAILMMADSVEAASRSLKEYTDESISELVEKIVNSQVADGFFVDCDITFKDILRAKQVLIERLKSIYHARISYPELQETTAGEE